MIRRPLGENEPFHAPYEIIDPDRRELAQPWWERVLVPILAAVAVWAVILYVLFY